MPTCNCWGPTVCASYIYIYIYICWCNFNDVSTCQDHWKSHMNESRAYLGLVLTSTSQKTLNTGGPVVVSLLFSSHVPNMGGLSPEAPSPWRSNPPCQEESNRSWRPWRGLVESLLVGVQRTSFNNQMMNPMVFQKKWDTFQQGTENGQESTMWPLTQWLLGNH